MEEVTTRPQRVDMEGGVNWVVWPPALFVVSETDRNSVLDVLSRSYRAPNASSPLTLYKTYSRRYRVISYAQKAPISIARCTQSARGPLICMIRLIAVE